MIELNPKNKIYFACEAVDFRKGIDGYAALCYPLIDQNPSSGQYFIFRNKAATAIKILLHDSTGFWLCHKRRTKGHFEFWPKAQGPALCLNAQAFAWLLQQ